MNINYKVLRKTAQYNGNHHSSLTGPIHHTHTKKKPLQIYHQQRLNGLGHENKSQQKAEWIILLDTHSDAYTRPVTLNGHTQGVKCMNICIRKNHSV